MDYRLWWQDFTGTTKVMVMGITLTVSSYQTTTVLKARTMLNAKTGQGEYVMHSGGVGKTRVYDIVGSPEGDMYMVGYTQSAVINWGGTLQTKILEEGIDQNDDAGTAFQMGKVSSNTNEYQFFAVKLAASEKALPSCVESCSLEGGNVANPIIQVGHCLIDNICYMEGDTSEIFGRPCLSCKPEQNNTGWSLGGTYIHTYIHTSSTLCSMEILKTQKNYEYSILLPSLFVCW
jgi:hypothetical protein